MATIWDALSLMVILYLCLPVIFLLLTKDFVFAWITIGVLVCQILVKLSRLIQYPSSWSGVVMRPSGASNCSCWNMGGSYMGRIGMPSGHVALTTFSLLSTALALNKKGILPKSITLYTTCLVIGVLILLMGISRLKRQCHNIWQVLVGGVLGVVLSLVWFEAYKKFWETKKIKM
jgi:membrane-associated phospholipid phosphatase